MNDVYIMIFGIAILNFCCFCIGWVSGEEYIKQKQNRGKK